MRFLSVRLIVSLIVGITLVTLAFSYNEVHAQKEGLRRDLERRAEVLAESMAGNVEPYLQRGSRRELQRIVERFGNREHLDGVAIYDKQGALVAITSGLAPLLSGRPSVVAEAISQDHGAGQFTRLDKASVVHIYALPLHSGETVVGSMAIVHDASYINTQSARIWRETFVRVLVQVFRIALITLLIVRWSIVGPIAKAAQWMRALRMGRGGVPSAPPDSDLLRPLTREMETIARSLTAARSAAEKEAQLRDAGESVWTAERLSAHMRSRLGEHRLLVVSNRVLFATPEGANRWK